MPRVRATRRDLVLDVGSGGFPHSTADVLIERFLDDIQNHRSHNKLVRDRPLVCADVTALPFRQNAFDYIICNHVIEHVEDAGQAVRELSRVGKRGYVNVPSEFWEFIAPSPAHRWVCAYKDGTLLLKPKRAQHDLGLQMYGGVFHFFQAHSDFRRLSLRRPDLFSVAFEWQDSIRYRVCADDEGFYDYHDLSSVEHLLKPVPAGGPVDVVKRWFKIYLDLKQLGQLAKAKARLRRFVKWVTRTGLEQHPSVASTHGMATAATTLATVDPFLLNILVCPADKQSLSMNRERLVCSSCHRGYPVQNGIPIMLIEEAHPAEQTVDHAA